MLARSWKIRPNRLRAQSALGGTILAAGLALLALLIAFLMVQESQARAGDPDRRTSAIVQQVILLNTTAERTVTKATSHAALSAAPISSIAAPHSGTCCEEASHSPSTSCSGDHCVGCSAALLPEHPDFRRDAGVNIPVLPARTSVVVNEPATLLRPPRSFL
jgi:hypothetical protein